MTLAFLPDKKIAEAFKDVGKTLAGAAEDVKDFFKGWGRRRKRVSICLVSQSVCLSVCLATCISKMCTFDHSNTVHFDSHPESIPTNLFINVSFILIPSGIVEGYK